MNTLQTTKEIEMLPPAEDKSVDRFIEQAIAGNLPVETMEKLFALREKVKAETAREAFVLALSGFQSECPIIEKKKKVLNKDGSIRYQFAPLEDIIDQIKAPLARYGFSYTWNLKNAPGVITAVCRVTHKLGHSETSEFEVPIDKEGFMTAPQKYASAQTFAKRYSLCNALGVSTGEEDTDATDVGKEGNAISDKAKIMFLLKKLGYKAKEKEAIVRTVQELTQLELEEKNYAEIVGRLEVIAKERQEEDNSVTID